MSYILALISGVLLALMIYFNGLLSTSTSFYWGNVIFQGIGLFIFSFILIIKGKSHSHILQNDLKYGFIALALPGLLGAFTIILSNIVIINIGVTLMVGISLLGQMITSMIIDANGFLGKDKKSISWAQISGSGLMLLGLWLLLA